MKNFKKFLSKRFETFSKDNTYGFAIRGHALPFAKRVEDRRDSGRHKGA